MAEDDMAVPEKLMEELGKQQQGRRWTRSCVGLVLVPLEPERWLECGGAGCGGVGGVVE
jgi:hypothetical protein